MSKKNAYERILRMGSQAGPHPGCSGGSDRHLMTAYKRLCLNHFSLECGSLPRPRTCRFPVPQCTTKGAIWLHSRRPANYQHYPVENFSRTARVAFQEPEGVRGNRKM